MTWQARSRLEAPQTKGADTPLQRVHGGPLEIWSVALGDAEVRRGQPPLGYRNLVPSLLLFHRHLRNIPYIPEFDGTCNSPAYQILVVK
jgi:hypothetical protein